MQQQIRIYPKELLTAGNRARSEGAEGWRLWFYRPWTEQRVKEKERIYKELLHGKANETTRREMAVF